MMMKKLLICTVILTGLSMTACVKKEAPKEEEQVEVTPASEVLTPEPAKFEPLEAVEDTVIEPMPETTVEIEREQTANTTTEIRREVKKPEPVEAAPAVEATTPPVQETPAAPVRSAPASAPVSTPKTNTNVSKSEDDAVADAIAAAMPALN